MALFVSLVPKSCHGCCHLFARGAANRNQAVLIAGNAGENAGPQRVRLGNDIGICLKIIIGWVNEKIFGDVSILFRAVGVALPPTVRTM